MKVGIIPRAVKQLYEGIARRQDEARESGIPIPEFKVSATFLELYNEDILDLFDNASSGSNKSMGSSIVGGYGKRSSSNAGSTGIRIHEDSNGNIYTVRSTLQFFFSIQAVKSFEIQICSFLMGNKLSLQQRQQQQPGNQSNKCFNRFD